MNVSCVRCGGNKRLLVFRRPNIYVCAVCSGETAEAQHRSSNGGELKKFLRDRFGEQE
jgi:hypothetical protein